jgi:hypothetical protein
MPLVHAVHTFPPTPTAPRRLGLQLAARRDTRHERASRAGAGARVGGGVFNFNAVRPSWLVRYLLAPIDSVTVHAH